MDKRALKTAFQSCSSSSSLSSSSSSSSSERPLLADEDGDAGNSTRWYTATIVSPTSFSPVTFMTDSNRSAPTPPPPRADTTYFLGDDEPLAAFPQQPSATGNGATRRDAPPLAANNVAPAPSTAAQPSLSFSSSFFSSTTSGSTSLSSTSSSSASFSSSNTARGKAPQLARTGLEDAAAHSSELSRLSSSSSSSSTATPPTAVISRENTVVPLPTVEQLSLSKTPELSEAFIGGAASSAKPVLASPGGSASKNGEGGVQGGRKGKESKSSAPTGERAGTKTFAAPTPEAKGSGPGEELMEDGDDERILSTPPISQVAERDDTSSSFSVRFAIPRVAAEPHLPVLPASTPANVAGCTPLSQLASGLLCGEVLGMMSGHQSPPESPFNTAQLSWEPAPLLGDAPKKKAGKRSRNATSMPMTASGSLAKSLSTAPAEQPPSPRTEAPEVGTEVKKATAKPARKRRRRGKEDTVSVSTAKEGNERDTGKPSLLSTSDTPTTPPPPPSLTPPQTTAETFDDEARKEAEEPDSYEWLPLPKDPEPPSHSRGLLAQTPDESFGEFSFDAWPSLGQHAAYDGNGTISSLSQLSFLVSQDLAEEEESKSHPPLPPPSPPPKKRMRKPRGKQQEQKVLRAATDAVHASTRSEREEPPTERELIAMAGAAVAEAELLLHSGKARCESGSAYVGKDAVLPSRLEAVERPPTTDATDKTDHVDNNPEAAQKPKKTRSRKKASKSSSTKVAEEKQAAEDSLRWWEATCTAARFPRLESGRPCLWIELSESLYEAHGDVLRQLLVLWGCAHQPHCTSGVETAGPKVRHASPEVTVGDAGPPSKQHKHEPTANNHAAPSNHVLVSVPAEALGGGNDGVVILLCPPTVSVDDALQWWTRRAHVAHGFLPPLLAVSMSVESTTKPGSFLKNNQAHAAAAGDSGRSAEVLLSRAVLHTACDALVDPRRSLAVTCSAGGKAALSQLLPQHHIYTSLDSCATMLRGVLQFPLPAELCSGAGATQCEDTDVGSLVAVMVAASCGQHAQEPAESALLAPLSRRPAASLQDRCFQKLCEWNALAARLRDTPRRPQLLLHRTCIDSAFAVDPEAAPYSKNADPASASVRRCCPSDGASASVWSTKALPTLSLWMTYGMVRPATRNADTFADTADRGARLLASHAPPVTLLPPHRLALNLFGSVLFTRDNYVTAVNVVDAHARASQRRLTDFISGYGCVVTGPLRYTVSATVRRYLHVQLSIDVAPLLAVAGGIHNSTGIHLGDAPAAAAAAVCAAPEVVSFTQTQWRAVLPLLSCTCRPGLFEQVPHTDDGVKVCRHLAEVFYFFTTQQFRVVRGEARIGGMDAGNTAVASVGRLAERASPLVASSPTFPVARTGTASKTRSSGAANAGGAVRVKRKSLAAPQRSRSVSTSSSEPLLDMVPLSVLYSHSFSDALSDEGDTVAEPCTAPSGPAVGVVVKAEGRDGSRNASCSPMNASAGSVKRESEAEEVPLTQLPLATETSTAASGHTPSMEVPGFHAEALAYALRFIAQRARGGEPVTEAVTETERNARTEGVAQTPTFSEQSVAPRAVAEEDEGFASSSTGRADQARALQMVEQLLRDALR